MGCPPKPKDVWGKRGLRVLPLRKFPRWRAETNPQFFASLRSFSIFFSSSAIIFSEIIAFFTASFRGLRGSPHRSSASVDLVVSQERQRINL